MDIDGDQEKHGKKEQSLHGGLLLGSSFTNVALSGA
jgi:hypothetical protein